MVSSGLPRFIDAHERMKEEKCVQLFVQKFSSRLHFLFTYICRPIFPNIRQIEYRSVSSCVAVIFVMLARNWQISSFFDLSFSSFFFLSTHPIPATGFMHYSIVQVRHAFKFIAFHSLYFPVNTFIVAMRAVKYLLSLRATTALCKCLRHLLFGFEK